MVSTRLLVGEILQQPDPCLWGLVEECIFHDSMQRNLQDLWKTLYM